MIKKRFALFLVVLLVIMCSLVGCGETKDQANQGQKQEIKFPERAITIINPYAPGGSCDLQARILGKFMQEELGQTVNIVSKSGGAGAVGMNAAKEAKPDGYTIILTAIGPCVLTPNHSDVGYNTVNDFEPISQVASLPNVVSVHKDSGINTFEELIDYARKNPNEAIYGTCGAGLYSHIIMSDLLSKIEGVDIKHVPFNGGNEAISALVGKHVLLTINSLPEALPHYQAGTFKCLAVNSIERTKEMPDVPTFKELGFEGISPGAWFGFLAPQNTPSEIIEKLDSVVKKALNDPDVQEKFNNVGVPIDYLSTKDFAEVIKNDYEVSGKLIKLMK